VSIQALGSNTDNLLQQVWFDNSNRTNSLATSLAGQSDDSSSTASVSSFAQLLSQLQEMATSSPDQFQQQTSDIATQLSTLASQSSGTEASLFQDLATSFQNASTTGSVSALLPQSTPASSSTSDAALLQAMSTDAASQLTSLASGTSGVEANFFNSLAASLQSPGTSSTTSSTSGTSSSSSSSDPFAELVSLASSDPTQFQQTTADIASKLSTLASQSTGTEAEFFSSLASKFDQASQTGSASSLTMHGHHHHHHGSGGSSQAANAYAASASGSSTDALLSMLNGLSADGTSSSTVTANSLFGALTQSLS
jgi:hypothetical protein